MTDTMRERFEKWYAKQYPDPAPDYAADEARIIKDNRWHVWQAAQVDARALVGELISWIKSADHHSNCDYTRGFPRMDCSCGYDAALTKAQAFMEGK